jgi:hypothetical protein
VRLALALALAVVAVGAEPAAAAGVGCADGSAGAAHVDRTRDAVLGPLALLDARLTPGSPRDAFGDHGYKLPVTLPAGRTVTLRVPRAARKRAGLVFTLRAQDRATRHGVAGADRAVRFRACAGPGRTGWSGGVVVDRPRCVTLVVSVAGGERVRRRVPLGRRC